MTLTLFAAELMLLAISTMAFVIFWDLYRTRNGRLRLIMMGYMVVEILVYLGSAIFFWMIDRGFTKINMITFCLFVLPFKLAIKTILFIWIRSNDGL